MAARVLKKLNEELVCCICQEEYENPKTLPCLHSFCLKCILRTKQSRNPLVCPVCRRHCHILNPSELPNAITINTLMDIKQAAIDGGDDDNYDTEECPDHGEEMKILCVTCEEVICLECLAYTHKGHKYSKIIECYQQHKEEIDSKLVKLQEKIDELEMSLVQMQTLENEIHQNGEILKIDINTRAAEITERVARKKKELVDIVDNEVQLQVAGIQSVKDNSQDHVMRLVKVKKETTNYMKVWSKPKIVLNKQKLVKTLTEIINEKKPSKHTGVNSSELNIEFKSQKIRDETLVFGEITEKPHNINCNTSCFTVVVITSIVLVIVAYYYPEYFKQ